MSLRTGGQIALATAPIINPNNLKIEGWYCQDRFSKQPLILVSQDIRDFIKQGIVINDHDVLSEVDELVRLKPIVELQFELLGKTVYTNHKKRLGKVSDYAVDSSSLYIQKIYVNQSIIKSFSGGGLSIDRTQVIEVTPKRVVITDPLQPLESSAAVAPSPLPAS
jgi:sporulation protein YlmC with PRC-barrel domain